MEADLAKVLKKSEILTHHSAHTVSLPSLPLMHPQSTRNMPKTKQYSYLTTRGRQQILKDSRKKDLLLLRESLNEQYRSYNSQQLIKALQQERKTEEVQFTDKLERKLSLILANQKRDEQPLEVIELDPDKQDFIHRCLTIVQLLQVISRENNMRFKNRVISTIERTGSKQQLLKLLSFLSKTNVDYDSLYSRFRKAFLSSEGCFRRDLKFISLTCQHLSQYYQNNRYKHLNEDILRIKSEMTREGASIGRKLHVVGNAKLRNGIVASLKGVDLVCKAHRNLYDEVQQQMRSSQL